jgi:GTP-binding protein Era
MISDQPERQLVAELIREKLLENLDKEVPHGVAVEIEQYKERDNGIMDVSAVIYCERKTHKGIIIGKGGAMLKKIGAAARQECEELLDAKVFLQLWVKVKEEWRNNPALIRNFGYEQE